MKEQTLEEAIAILRLVERAGLLGGELTRFRESARNGAKTPALTHCAARTLKLIAEEMAACPCGHCKPVPAPFLAAIDKLIARHEADVAAAAAGATFHGIRGEA